MLLSEPPNTFPNVLFTLLHQLDKLPPKAEVVCCPVLEVYELTKIEPKIKNKIRTKLKTNNLHSFSKTLIIKISGKNNI